MNNDSLSLETRGRRLLPNLIDEIASSDPTRIFASIPLSNDLQDGFRDIDFADFARSINHCAWWIEKNLGRSETFQTLNYVGPQDLRYTILPFAAIKTGYQVLFISPQNSTEGHIALLESLQCKILLVSEALPARAQDILSRRKMRTLAIPSLQHLLNNDLISFYPYTKTFEQSRHEPFIVLHTSGSTGTQKPIILTHGTMSQHDTFLLPPPPNGQPIALSLYKNARVFIGLGLFHSAAICFMTLCIYSSTILVLPPPIPMTPTLANLAHLHGNLIASFLSPAILVPIAKTPEYLVNIRKLRHLHYGGGPLPREIGNVLKSHTHLSVQFGTTESGFSALQITDPDDWEYMSFSPIMGIELRLYTEGLYQLYFVRDTQLALSQGIFATFPDLTEYTTKDLFSKHPTKAGLWLFEGRSDDIIVCSTGQKIHPMSMEGLVNAHPLVTSAIMCGQGRIQVCLLVEVKDTCTPRDERERDALIEDIWRTVERGNEKEQAHGRITRELILLTEEGRPMVRAGKGTVLRGLTEERYRAELDAVYLRFRDCPLE
ncbi:hypothetical protein SBOR_3981 [Sclerotinia borealis F-4128]|uniref:AMP-dependent synthetase/ligase domain-containing protein n=1 Tax=Sclerotinia borealis (strain F-4128) TaxID=1432307 RepID=W9CI18_SCLBF|nr:hypothetical protein SBOR_3981 [Sclerotinia borealis F-4128]